MSEKENQTEETIDGSIDLSHENEEKESNGEVPENHEPTGNYGLSEVDLKSESDEDEEKKKFEETSIDKNKNEALELDHSEKDEENTDSKENESHEDNIKIEDFKNDEENTSVKDEDDNDNNTKLDEENNKPTDDLEEENTEEKITVNSSSVEKEGEMEENEKVDKSKEEEKKEEEEEGENDNEKTSDEDTEKEEEEGNEDEKSQKEEEEEEDVLFVRKEGENVEEGEKKEEKEGEEEEEKKNESSENDENLEKDKAEENKEDELIEQKSELEENGETQGDALWTKSIKFAKIKIDEEEEKNTVEIKINEKKSNQLEIEPEKLPKLEVKIEKEMQEEDRKFMLETLEYVEMDSFPNPKDDNPEAELILDSSIITRLNEVFEKESSWGIIKGEKKSSNIFKKGYHRFYVHGSSKELKKEKKKIEDAFSGKKKTGIFRLLKQKDFDPDDPDYLLDGFEIHFFAFYGKTEELKRSIHLGRDVNIVNYYNNTPLHLAVQKNQINAVKILLSCPDIQPNAMNKNKDTPLMIATRKGSKEILGLLLKDEKTDRNIISPRLGKSAQSMTEDKEIIDLFSHIKKVEEDFLEFVSTGDYEKVENIYKKNEINFNCIRRIPDENNPHISQIVNALSLAAVKDNNLKMIQLLVNFCKLNVTKDLYEDMKDFETTSVNKSYVKFLNYIYRKQQREKMIMEMYKKERQFFDNLNLLYEMFVKDFTTFYSKNKVKSDKQNEVIIKFIERLLVLRFQSKRFFNKFNEIVFRRNISLSNYNCKTCDDGEAKGKFLQSNSTETEDFFEAFSKKEHLYDAICIKILDEEIKDMHINFCQAIEKFPVMQYLKYTHSQIEFNFFIKDTKRSKVVMDFIAEKGKQIPYPKNGSIEYLLTLPCGRLSRYNDFVNEFFLNIWDYDKEEEEKLKAEEERRKIEKELKKKKKMLEEERQKHLDSLKKKKFRKKKRKSSMVGGHNGSMYSLVQGQKGTKEDVQDIIIKIKEEKRWKELQATLNFQIEIAEKKRIKEEERIAEEERRTSVPDHLDRREKKLFDLVKRLKYLLSSQLENLSITSAFLTNRKQIEMIQSKINDTFENFVDISQKKERQYIWHEDVVQCCDLLIPSCFFDEKKRKNLMESERKRGADMRKAPDLHTLNVSLFILSDALLIGDMKKKKLQFHFLLNSKFIFTINEDNFQLVIQKEKKVEETDKTEREIVVNCIFKYRKTPHLLRILREKLLEGEKRQYYENRIFIIDHLSEVSETTEFLYHNNKEFLRSKRFKLKQIQREIDRLEFQKMNLQTEYEKVEEEIKTVESHQSKLVEELESKTLRSLKEDICKNELYSEEDLKYETFNQFQKLQDELWKITENIYTESDEEFM